ncbi:unnamed protein product [Durusdinium trenchii]|uniref:EF-hand domain-containing protein n=1 Tax=Durusdinium trenchii TaxID=1381693 RepID=A0ABP0T052_9DINO
MLSRCRGHVGRFGKLLRLGAVRHLAVKALPSFDPDNGQELAILAQAFQRYDGDGSGALDATELQRALQDLDLPAGDVEVSELFSKLDVNKDGTVELTEWLDHMPAGTKLKVLQKADEAGRTIRFEIPDVKIMYTHTDEAPMLATYSLLPVLRAYCRFAGVKIMKKDISLSARIIANFPDYVRPAQRMDDDLTELGNLAKHPAANIIKLPNISASVPQLLAAIKELQAKGFNVPDFPAEPKTEQEIEIRSRYAKVLGSAVNPVLREGNSDRRVAKPVKEYAMKHPHKNHEWSSSSKSSVASMSDGDFFSSEQSCIMEDVSSVRIELVTSSGTTVLKAKTPLLSGEVIDGSVMRVAELRNFYEKEMESTEPGTLFSLHLKATMMKVSDPVLFGHCVEVYYKDAFQKHSALFKELGVNPNNGVGDVYTKIAGHPKQAEVEADLAACYEKRPPLAYVDSRRGITNLHVPSDVIVDASMAAAVRDAGRMWTKDDELCDAKFVIPDRCYSGIYDVIIEDCKANGKLDASKIGTLALDRPIPSIRSVATIVVVYGPCKLAITKAKKLRYLNEVSPKEKGRCSRMREKDDQATDGDKRCFDLTMMMVLQDFCKTTFLSGVPHLHI